MDAPSDRIRRHTAKDVLRRIDDETLSSLSHHASASASAIDERLKALDREWDIDRVLETEAATLGLIGLALGFFIKPRFLALSAAVAASVLLQATKGPYPLMPVFRRLGLRTSREIQRERYALKALRGDFSSLTPSASAPSVPSHGLH
ncbi:MAG: hypothetical protein ACM3VZ_02560 [Acidobacteriota bacterium]